MTNPELVAYIRDAFEAKQYPWWTYFQPAIIIEIADRLEHLNAELLRAADRVAAQAEILSSRGERLLPRNSQECVGMLDNDRCCLSYWFPKLLAAGIPVPRTVIYKTTTDLTPLCDGKEPERWAEFVRLLGAAADSLGSWPIFLRTGQGSAKHQWKNTCFVACRDDLPNHIAPLVEWSHMVDILGLPHDVWCVREMLPVIPLAVLPRYGNMPLVSELRCFINAGKVQCAHPYWPEGAIRDGLAENSEHLAKQLFYALHVSRTGGEIALSIAADVAQVFKDDGAWSVDLLETKRGWFVTDMAVAGSSYHDPACPSLKLEPKKP